jgi:cytochrome c
LRTRILLPIAAAVVLAGCRQDMHDQPRFKPYAGTSFFPDGRSARPALDGTVSRGHLKTDARLHKGREGDGFTAQIPLPVTKAFIERGQARFNIYCTPCHGRLGDGEGMVVKRGFKHPPTFHQDRLRSQPVGYIYDVITNGYGSMISYASRIPVEDRWAIVSYVRTLQYSQNANPVDLTDADKSRLDAPPAQQAHGNPQEHKGAAH